MGHWFILANDKVTGPFQEDEIKAQVASGTTNESALVWGRTLSQWKTIRSWMNELPQMTASMQSSIAAASPAHQMWHFAVDGVSKGPMSRAELVSELKALRSKGEVLVWTKGMKAWADLYEFHDLLDEVGLNRREHPRARIDGAAVIQFDDKTLIARLRTIGPGGFGATGLDMQVAIGQSVQVELKSQSMSTTVSAKATVQYISDGGFFGFKFSNVSQEAKSMIIEYTRKQAMIEKAAA